MAPVRQPRERKKMQNRNKKSKYFENSQYKNPKETRERVVAKDGVTKESRSQMQVTQPDMVNLGVFTKRLHREFFDKPAETLATSLLGKILCRVTECGERLCGKIVETEAYLGAVDPACHSYEGRRTTRNEAMYGTPGTSYVYFIYGMYHCFNISSRESGACVLVRALEPVQGLDTMRKLRSEKRRSTSKLLKDHELTNGPSKLCTAMNINKDSLNNTDLVKSEKFWLEDGTASDSFTVIHTTRIGIESYGEESACKLYRYYIFGNKNVSVRDKNAEKKLSFS